jgi:hypothetical protein
MTMGRLTLVIATACALVLLTTASLGAGPRDESTGAQHLELVAQCSLFFSDELAAQRRDAFIRLDDSASEPAAKRYLETLIRFGSSLEPPRVECFELLEKDIDRLERLHCPRDLPPSPAVECQLIRQIQRDIGRAQGDRLLLRAHLPVSVPATMSAADFMDLMAVDKKVRDGKLRLVLLERMNQATLVDDVETALVRGSIEACREPDPDFGSAS